MKRISYFGLAVWSAALALGGVMTSCDDDKIYTTDYTEVVPVSEINFKVSEVLPLAVGTDSTLVVTVGPENADDLSIVFKSNDESVATVDQEGTIHAVALGEATITATPPVGFGALATVIVNVIPEVIKAQSLTVINTTPVGEEGGIYATDQLDLVAQILPENHTYDYVTWSSDNESVATVDENGHVVCVAAGTAVITAVTHDKSGVKGSITIEVRPYIAAEKVEIAKWTDPVCATDAPFALNVTYTPSNATLGSVEWVSSDEKVATVHRGVVTPVGFGSCLISAKLLSTGDVVQTEITVEPGWWKWDAFNKWGVDMPGWKKWIPANTSNQTDHDERLDKVWRLVLKNPGEGKKWRGDIKVNCDATNPFTLTLSKYPVLAVRIDKAPGGNATLDMVSTDGSIKQNGGNLNPKDGTKLADGTQLLIYDVASKFPGIDAISFRTFQIKMADIPYANMTDAAPWYDVYWIRTFASVAEAEAFAAEDVANNPK